MRALAIGLLLCAARVEAAPGWAKQADAADAGGHTFICEGKGKSEEDALSAAHGVCNDKICKVCGVEVESVTETKETLTGVDFQRKVVERCRRVRSADTKVLYKSSDCGPDGCTAWIQIRYSKEDEQRECSRYAKEDFADPAACEKDIEGFARTEGRTAKSFHDRTAHLDAALIHCDKIDVRPTPAILALDAKLRHGMDAFEWVGTGREDPYSKPYWAFYLAAYSPLKRQLAESKQLTDRIKLVRDYVANKALVFEVIEAVRARDWETPAGIERLRAAMEKAPAGSQYGASKVHFGGLFQLQRAKVDVEPIAALMRKLYPPDKLEAGEPWELALFFGGDGKVTEEEWRYSFAAHRQRRCDNCLRVLLEKQDHGAPETRVARFFEAWNTVPQKDRDNPKRAFSVFRNMTGYHAPGLVLELEPKLPESIRAAFDYDYFDEFLTRFRSDTPKDAKAAMIARASAALAKGPSALSGRTDEQFCSAMADKLKRLKRHGGDWTASRGRICACLEGPLRARSSNYVNKSDLEQIAEKDGLKCAVGD